MRACADCVRRAQLLRELTPRIDRPAGGRPPLLLAQGPEQLSLSVLGVGAPRPRTLDRTDDDLLSCAEQDEREFGVESVCGHAPEYPGRLRALRDPPAVLHVLGGVERLQRVLGPDLDRPSVAVVGARKAPDDARRYARRLAEAVAAAGITVVSGMAFGIDELAHEGALAAGAPEAGGARSTGAPRPGGTLAVLAGGAERATPATLRRLYARIASDGAVVSELPPGSSPRPWSFPARNRLIAALSDGLVVVAAARGSGSLGSVAHARKLDRPVGVVPGSVLDPAFAGGNDLLRGDDLGRSEDGGPGPARAIVEPDDVRLMLLAERLLPSDGGAPGPRSAGDGAPGAETSADDAVLGRSIAAADPLVGLEGRERRIAERLVGGPRTIESLIAEEDPATILAGLGALEASGRLRRSLNGDLELTVGRTRS